MYINIDTCNLHSVKISSLSKVQMSPIEHEFYEFDQLQLGTKIHRYA